MFDPHKPRPAVQVNALARDLGPAAQLAGAALQFANVSQTASANYYNAGDVAR